MAIIIIIVINTQAAGSYLCVLMQTLICAFLIRVSMEVNVFQYSTTTYAYVDLVTAARNATIVSIV